MIWQHVATGREVRELGGFPIIYADPPWDYADKTCSGGVGHEYGTTATTDLKSIPVGDLAAPDAVLFMWATYPMIADALALGAAWGFTYKTIAFQWLKLNRKNGEPFFGLGRWTRGNTEPCLLFVKGKPKRISAGVSQLILEHPIGAHSAKPPIVREKIVELMGDVPAVELFARERVPGWECFGNEVESSVILR